MSNKEFLKSLGLNITDDPFANNTIANEYFDYLNDFDIIDYEKNIFAIRIAYAHAFNDKYWANLSIGEKLRLLYWVKQDYLKQKGVEYNADKPFSFFSHYNLNSTGFRALTISDTILLNLEELSLMSGYEALTVVLHEAQHIYDFKQKYKLIKELAPYLKTINADEIMAMPITEKIYNHEKQKYDIMSIDLQQKILLLKNLHCCVPVGEDFPYHKCEVKDYYMYQKYLQNIYYHISPLESRAYNFSNYFLNNGFGLTKDEKVANEDINYNNRYLEYTNSHKKVLEKYFGKSYPEIINMALIKNYNVLVYKSDVEKYICLDLMEELDNLEQKYYNIKFKGREN